MQGGPQDGLVLVALVEVLQVQLQMRPQRVKEPRAAVVKDLLLPAAALSLLQLRQPPEGLSNDGEGVQVALFYNGGGLSAA